MAMVCCIAQGQWRLRWYALASDECAHKGVEIADGYAVSICVETEVAFGYRFIRDLDGISIRAADCDFSTPQLVAFEASIWILDVQSSEERHEVLCLLGSDDFMVQGILPA